MKTTAQVGHIYRHFKGEHYIVREVAKDATMDRELVVYQKLPDGPLWARPRDEFEDLKPGCVETSPHAEPRFTHVSGPKRLSWDEYFIAMTHLIAMRATCDRKHVGAVFVRDNRVIATGYNGSPPGLPHCDDVGHDLVETDGRLNCVRTVHAEQNAVHQAAQHGVSLVGSVLYTNTFPCWMCAKALLSVRVSKVMYDADYNNDKRAMDAFTASGVELVQWVKPVDEFVKGRR